MWPRHAFTSGHTGPMWSCAVTMPSSGTNCLLFEQPWVSRVIL